MTATRSAQTVHVYPTLGLAHTTQLTPLSARILALGRPWRADGGEACESSQVRAERYRFLVSRGVTQRLCCSRLLEARCDGEDDGDDEGEWVREDRRIALARVRREVERLGVAWSNVILLLGCEGVRADGVADTFREDVERERRVEYVLPATRYEGGDGTVRVIAVGKGDGGWSGNGVRNHVEWWRNRGVRYGGVGEGRSRW